MGNHRASAPSRRIIPATPRNDAADRYSPEIALALAAGPTVREATKKSDVLRATRTPSDPITADASATRPMATSATRPAVVIGTLCQRDAPVARSCCPSGQARTVEPVLGEPDSLR